jgi:hypothetical protein
MNINSIYKLVVIKNTFDMTGTICNKGLVVYPGSG